MSMTKREKIHRTVLLEQQGQKCALCSARCITARGMSYRSAQNAMICRKCTTGLGNYLADLARNVTPKVIEAYLAREPAPEPTTIRQHTRKKLLPEQLACRQDILDGKVNDMNVEDWEHRAGVYGTDYVEEYRLKTTKTGVTESKGLMERLAEVRTDGVTGQDDAE